MNGTEKQIKWAEEIKADLLAALPKALADVNAIDAPAERKAPALTALAAVEAKLSTETSAVWFINHRCFSGPECVADRISMFGRIYAEGRRA